MRLPIPGPAAVLSSATAAAGAVETALALVPRAAEAMTRVEALLDRAEAAVERVEQVVDKANATNTRAGAVIDQATLVSRNANRAVDGVNGLSDRADVALQMWEPLLRRLAPKAQRFAESLSEAEVDAAIAIVDRLPQVLEHIETDVLPILHTLDRVGPDVHELLEVVEDLRRVITGLPGIGLLRNRGDDEVPPLEHTDEPPEKRRR